MGSINFHERLLFSDDQFCFPGKCMVVTFVFFIFSEMATHNKFIDIYFILFLSQTQGIRDQI